LSGTSEQRLTRARSAQPKSGALSFHHFHYTLGLLADLILEFRTQVSRIQNASKCPSPDSSIFAFTRALSSSTLSLDRNLSECRSYSSYCHSLRMSLSFGLSFASARART
jgi:hypothetical protein